MPEFSGTRDLRSYFRTIWRWKYLVLFFVLACPLAAYLLERGKPSVYTSSALVGVNQTTVNTSTLSGGGSFSTTNVTAIARIVTTSPVASVAADILHEPGDASHLVSEVSASGDVTTDFVTITATDTSPTRAAAIANAFAKAISQNLQKTALTQIQNSISGVQAELARTSRHDSTRPTLVQQLDQLKAARATQGSEAAILQPAAVPSSPSGPHLRRTVELGLLLGLLLAFGAVVLAESADRRLRSPEDLEGMTELPLLASIAPSAFSDALDTGPQDDEAFQMLRTSLMYFNAEQLESVMITSAGEKEGKTTVATRLAIVTARAGMNVVLVDADLRRAQTSERFSLRGASEGLAPVLAGRVDLADALVEYPLEDSASPSGRLQILPAGPPPPNPSALISSHRMIDVLKHLEGQTDLVLIDTPAALAVSDPFALVPNVSGVVIVARMNRSTRQTIRRLQKMINSAQGTLLGVAATGVTAGTAYYEHYSTKYYAAQANGSPEPKKSRIHLRRAPQADGIPSTRPE
jgi:succinoglycan biosynthesis transport protein ExoP